MLIQTTADGSHTLFVPEIGESYHSIHGAIQESTVVFIEQGLRACSLNTIHVLEIGFGTGLNALLTALEACRTKKRIHYTTIERFPVSIENAHLLNYPELLLCQIIDCHSECSIAESKNLRDPSTSLRMTERSNLKHFMADKSLMLNCYEQFDKIHQASWEEDVDINPYFVLHKIKTDFTTCSLSGMYDVVYFDPFSPEKQPEMWEESCFREIADHCSPDAILTTYCAKGSVRRTLQKVGFRVERLPGPPGKREILRAKKLFNPDFFYLPDNSAVGC